MQSWLLRGILALAFGALCTLPAAAAARWPFLGKWDCGVAEFTFTRTTYNNGSEDMPIKKVEKTKDGSYTLRFADGYSIGLSGFTKDTMAWFSPESGDSFECRRTDK